MARLKKALQIMSRLAVKLAPWKISFSTQTDKNYRFWHSSQFYRFGLDSAKNH